MNRESELPHRGQEWTENDECSERIPCAAIELQLGLILKSSTFSKLTRLSEILRFIVSETLAGRQNSIKASAVSVKVFGRDPLLNPNDPIVRISAGRLRRALDDYYSGEGSQDPILIRIPKGTYVPEFSRLSNEKPLRSVGPPRVAVLPFVNHGQVEDLLVDTLGEELSVQLARFQDIAVLAYWTTSQIRSNTPDILSTGRDLDADFVICGSATRSASRIRVNVECIDIDSAVQIWARHYDQDLSLKHLFEIQDEIVKSASTCIGDEFGSISRNKFRASQAKPVRDLDAYEAVLAGHHYARHLDENNHVYARRALERAVEIEPNYALAWALLGDIYCDIRAFDMSELDEPLLQAERCVQQALSLDPECQHAQWTSAFIGVLTQDHSRIVEAVDNVVRLNPNSAFMVGAAAVWLGTAGYFERAYTLLELSEELNPRYPGWFNLLPWLNAFTGQDYDAALMAARKVNTPLNFWDPIMRASSLGKLGRIAEAASARDELIALRPDFVERHQHFLSCFIHDDAVRADVLDGLHAAGLKT